MSRFLIGAALAVTLAACGSGSEQQDAGSSDANVLARGYRDAAVQQEGNVITVSRTGEGAQGVMIAQAPVMVHFTVEGEGARMRLRQGDRVGYVPLQENNSVMLGRLEGAASQILIESDSAERIIVTVTGVTDCATAPEGTCVPPVLEPAPADAAPPAPAAEPEE
jgi:hypothetical protein